MYVYLHAFGKKFKLSINLHVCVDVCMNVCMDIWIEKGAGIVLFFFPLLGIFFGISYSDHFPY